MIYILENLEFVCICVKLLSKLSSWMMWNFHISDGTFQRDEAKTDTCRLREVIGVSPWGLGSILFPNYGSVHILLGNSTSTCHYTADLRYVRFPPASTTTVLFCQGFPNAVLTAISPFSSSPFALFSWCPASVLSSVVTRSLHNVQRRRILVILPRSLQRHKLPYSEADRCVTLHFDGFLNHLCSSQ